MLDNKKIKTPALDRLKELSYEMMVNIWEANCSECPHSYCAVNFLLHDKKIECKDIDEAISIIQQTGKDACIIRGCMYDDNYKSLREVCTNTCRLWSWDETESDEEYLF